MKTIFTKELLLMKHHIKDTCAKLIFKYFYSTNLISGLSLKKFDVFIFSFFLTYIFLLREPQNCAESRQMLRFTEIQISAMPGLPLYSGSLYDGTIKRLHVPAYKKKYKN